LKGCKSNIRQTIKAKEVEAKKYEEVQAKAMTEAIKEATNEKRNDEKQNLTKIRLPTQKSETKVEELFKMKARRETEEQVSSNS
jgi:ethanolamine utilization protein EutQ (cupin superfamily)